MAAMLAGLTLTLALSIHATAEPVSSPGSLNAEAAALIDVHSGRILFSQNGDKRMKIASLTKIMTAIVAIEHGRLTDSVKAGKRAVGKEGSSIYLKLGEEMSLLHLLYGLMLRSGNDAAVAIAEHVGGSEEGFVWLMNAKAEFLGLKNTQFRNPHGLDEEGHYSTANDMAKLTAYALQNPTFREIVKTKVKTVPDPGQPWNITWYNKNKMLTLYEGADGVKTGYTKQALRCLVSSATRNGQQLAAVTLNDPDDWTDHRKLLDFGFQNYPLHTLAREGESVRGYPYTVGRAFQYPLAEQEEGSVTAKLILNHAARTYPFDPAGRLEFYIAGQKIGGVPVFRSDREALQARDDRLPGTAREAELTFTAAFMEVIESLFRISVGASDR
jgi:D-alanyl-D-alanine carboxypeptidase